MTMVGINRLHWPVTVLGPGRRVGIWFQGCSIGCPGCVSRDTWAAPDPGDQVSVGDLVDRIDALTDDGVSGLIDGVTVTGGEPFEQPEALEELLPALREWLDSRDAVSADLLVYTGFEEAEARRRGPGGVRTGGRGDRRPVQGG